MAHLTDMEELLSTIKPTLIQDYMREAMNCYMASAYRGCIVLSYIALFDDIYDKLGELGKVNQIAKTIHTEVTKKKNDQEVFEKYLIDQLSSKNLMSGLDSTFLDILRTLRNKSAHPSGHKPSSEEARFIFFEVIDRFLSKPILTTTQLVEDIISRLVNVNFFTNNDIGSIESVIREEITSLHDAAIPFLVKELSDKILSTDGYISKNARFFLLGLARSDNPIANGAIKSNIIQSKADDAKYFDIILELISVNAKCITDISEICFNRIKKIISDKINDRNIVLNETNLSHPLQVFTSLIRHFDDNTLMEKFADELNLLLERYIRSTMLIGLFNNHPKIFNLYFNYIINNAGSSNWNASNPMANFLIEIDEKLSQKVSNQQALKLILAIDNASKYGSFNAGDLRKAHYDGIPSIKHKAVYLYENNFSEAISIISEHVKNDEDKIFNFLHDLNVPIVKLPSKS